MAAHKHTKMFAPIFICVAFGLAIVVVFTFFMAPRSLFKSRPMNYNDCTKLQDSRVMEIYPPICVTKSGKRFVKDLPAIKMMGEPETSTGY